MAPESAKLRDLREILNEVERAVRANRESQPDALQTIKECRRIFDQESAKMNQAIFNDQPQQIRETCLKTVAVLVEILARA
jgi:hypothetical protein